MIYVVLGLIGAGMGSFYLHGRGDFLLGGVLGLLVAAVINQRNRLLSLEKRLVLMEKRIAGMFSGVDPAGPAESDGRSEPVRAAHADAVSEDRLPLPEMALAGGGAVETPKAVSPSVEDPVEMPSLELELSDAAIAGLESPSGPPHPDQPPPRQMAWATRSGNSSLAATSWCAWGWWCCCSVSPFW
jgi:hypothetical protein